MPETSPERPDPGHHDPGHPENRKMLTLARSARARTGADQGACVRDLDGRTYAAAAVALPSLRLSAVEVAVAMAISSGAAGLEACAVVSEEEQAREGDLTVLREFAGDQVTVLVADAAGQVVESTRT